MNCVITSSYLLIFTLVILSIFRLTNLTDSGDSHDNDKIDRSYKHGFLTKIKDKIHGLFKKGKKISVEPAEVVYAEEVDYAYSEPKYEPPHQQLVVVEPEPEHWKPEPEHWKPEPEHWKPEPEHWKPEPEHWNQYHDY